MCIRHAPCIYMRDIFLMRGPGSRAGWLIAGLACRCVVCGPAPRYACTCTATGRKLPAHAEQFTRRITRRRSVRLHPNPIPGFSCKLWFGSLVVIKRTPGPRKLNLRPPVCRISRGVWVVQGCWLPFPNYIPLRDYRPRICTISRHLVFLCGRKMPHGAEILKNR